MPSPRPEIGVLVKSCVFLGEIEDEDQDWVDAVVKIFGALSCTRECCIILLVILITVCFICSLLVSVRHPFRLTSCLRCMRAGLHSVGGSTCSSSSSTCNSSSGSTCNSSSGSKLPPKLCSHCDSSWSGASHSACCATEGERNSNARH